MATDRSNDSKLTKTEEALLQKVLSVDEYKPHLIYKVMNWFSSKINYKRIILSMVPSTLTLIFTGLFYPDNMNNLYSIISSFLSNTVVNYYIFRFTLSDQRIEIAYKVIMKYLNF